MEINKDIKAQINFDDYVEEAEDNDGHGGEHADGHSSYSAASFQIVNTIMGAGILSVPVAMRFMGLITGSCVIIALALVTVYSVYLLLKCKEITGKNGYSMFAKISMGPIGSLFVKIIIIINNFGLCCAYFRIFGETAHSLFETFLEPDHVLLTCWHNYIYVLFIGLVMSMLIFKDSLDSLKSASILGVTGITTFFICLMIIFFYKLSEGIIPEFTTEMLWPKGTALEFIGALPTLFLAFTFQFNVFPIYFTLKNRTEKEMIKATLLAVMFCLGIYFLTGIFGFLMYGYGLNDTILSALHDDILIYKGKDSFMMTLLIIINIAFLISSTMSIPLMFFSLKKNFTNSVIFCKKKFFSPHVNQGDTAKLLKNANEDGEFSKSSVEASTKYTVSNSSKVIIVLSLYLSIIALTILIPQLKIIFNLVGSTAANSISFILPNIFFIKLSKMGNYPGGKTISTILFSFGIVILFACLAAEIVRLV